jgi:RNA recognition motif-containing protein
LVKYQRAILITKIMTKVKEENGTDCTYESVMGVSENQNNESSIAALSKRLVTFRKWLSDDANVTVHPAICIVNGEATDGTKNAPVLVFEKTVEVNSTDISGRLGMIDRQGEQALYDRTMGCQVRAVREIRKDEVMMTLPRSAMISPDLVASSDAGRAILACVRTTKNNNDDSTTGSSTLGFWDSFQNTTEAENRHNSKMARQTGRQMLMKILQERKRVETALTKRQQERAQSMAENNNSPQVNYTLAEPETISTRAPLLAFLIQQRFAGALRPPVVSSDDASRKQFQAVMKTYDDNPLSTMEPWIQCPPGAPETFAPYARTLPSAVNTPVCWQRSELAFLSASIPGISLLLDVTVKTLQLAAEFLALLDAGVLERFPETFPEGLLTWERWVWAAAIVSSRNLPAQTYIDRGDTVATFKPTDPMEFQSPPDIWGELGVMIPLLDMLNHEIESHQVTWEPCVLEKPAAPLSESDVNTGVVIADDVVTPEDAPHPPRAIMHKRIRKGSELFCCYGIHSNHHLILQYGFAQLHNQEDEVKLGWGLADSVGHLDVPEDFEYPYNIEAIRRFLVFDTQDDEVVQKWWTEERLALLHTEAFKLADDVMASLKKGTKMTASANADGTYHPILLTALVVATMPKIELQKHLTSRKEKIVLTKRHMQVLQGYLVFLFSKKLEKLLQNVRTVIKDHFHVENLWVKASEGGLQYRCESAEEEKLDETFIGWQSFFDSHAYRATMEVENRYYAMGSDTCVLALFDGHLRALQNSLDGVRDEEKFNNGALQQIRELGFLLATENDDCPTTNGSSTPGSDKKSPKRKRNRQQQRATTVSNSAINRHAALKLHVGNLAFTTTPSEMYDFFASRYGKANVLECHIPVERDTGRSRGFGFVTVPESLAGQILDPLKKHEMNGRLLKLAKSNSAGTSDSGRSRSGPALTNDRCTFCGYRPKYCTCRGRSDPLIARRPMPVLDRPPDNPYYNFNGDRFRDPPRFPGGPPPPGFLHERDRYGRDFDPRERNYDHVEGARFQEYSRDRSRSPSGSRRRDFDESRSSRLNDDEYSDRRGRLSRSSKRRRNRSSSKSPPKVEK